MDWFEEILQNLRQGKTVTVQPPSRPALPDEEIITIIPYNPDEIAIGDLVLANTGHWVDFYQVKKIEDTRIYVGYPKGLDKSLVKPGSIYGKIIGRDLLFNKLELEIAIDNMELPEIALPLKVSQFKPTDFSDFSLPNEEKNIWILFGSKQLFNNPILFYLECIRYLQAKTFLYKDYYIGGSLCEFISTNKFTSLIQDWFKNLKVQTDLKWVNRIKRAMLLNDDWDDQVVLTETEEEFIAIFYRLT